MSNQNDKLHQQALDALADGKPSQAEQSALEGAWNYNQRRKEATARFGEIASQIWEKLEAGEAVGGVNTKEAWCGVVGIKIRWAQKAIHRYRVSVGRTEDALADPSLVHPLSVYIQSVEFDREEAYVTLGIEEKYEFKYSAEKRLNPSDSRPDGNTSEWVHTVYSVDDDFSISIDKYMVPTAGKDGMMVCPTCGWNQVVVDGNFPKHYHAKDSGTEVCETSEQPTREHLTEEHLVKTLYNKMKKTLSAMRLWRDDLKQEFDNAVRDETEAQKHGKERRSDAAKRGVQTRRAAQAKRLLDEALKWEVLPHPRRDTECKSHPE